MLQTTKTLAAVVMLLAICGREQAATPAVPLIQQNMNSITGHVSDSQLTPLANLRVELMNEVDSVIQTTRTDGSGLFVFRRLSDGNFQIRVLTSGTNYVSQTKRVQLARFQGFGAAFEDVEFVLTANSAHAPTGKPGVVFVQDVPDEARKLYRKAAEIIEKSARRKEAFSFLKNALEIYPQYFDALELLGTEQVREREYDLAVPVLTKALEVNSKAFLSCFALGVAQFNLKQLQPSIESFRRSISLNEKSVNANLWLGIALRQTSRLDEAETYLKRADLLAESRLPEAHWQLALLFNQLKRNKEAADRLELFLKVQPDARDAELIKKLIQRLRQQSGDGKKN